MSDINLSPLTFPGIAYGTHQGQYDLRSLLYVGGADTSFLTLSQMIESGTLGAPLLERLPLVSAIHEVLNGQVSRGISDVTVLARINSLRNFYSWCDTNGAYPITVDTVENLFRDWVENFIHRVRVKKDLKNMSAYRIAKNVDNLVSRVLDKRSGMLKSTRLSADSKKKKVLSTEADKQNLEDTFTFGHFLSDLSDALSIEVIQGPLPVIIQLRDGHVLTEWSGLKNADIVDSLNNPNANNAQRNKTLASRAAWEKETTPRTRFPLINLRIETEILIFIAQTGMNLSQAAKLRRGEFRYKTEGEDIAVFRVYKGRREGEVEFRIFKEYGVLFKRYLGWLDTIIPEEDTRLFPFVYPHKIPKQDAAPRFQAIIARCKKVGIKHFRPLALRSTRINWLLRKSRDPELVAEMAQHTKETLIRVYEQPHHQVAAAEISRFHRLTDPSITPPSPGACTSIKRNPVSIDTGSKASPAPDCINPAGCLFCEFHRDIDSQDYAWSLASFRHCKMLELDRFVPSNNSSPDHPVLDVITRISSKLKHMESSSEIRGAWVKESSNLIREGKYHPSFDGLIQLMELAV